MVFAADYGAMLPRHGTRPIERKTCAAFWMRPELAAVLLAAHIVRGRERCAELVLFRCLHGVLVWPIGFGIGHVQAGTRGGYLRQRLRQRDHPGQRARYRTQ